MPHCVAASHALAFPYLKQSLGSAALASPESLLEMQFSGSHLRPTESKSASLKISLGDMCTH